MADRVSVIVPHYRDLSGLDACLSALGRQTRRPDEIVVADNNSPEGREAVAAVVAGRAELVVVTEKGAGPARNGGVSACSGDVLAFTDSDCQPDPGWLAAALAALDRADIVGGEMRVLVADEANITPAEAFERVFAFDNRDYVLRKGFSVTANLVCRRALYDAVGPFRVGVAEDIEWCNRARAAGYRLGYAPDAIVGHPARRTWAELERKWRRVNEEAYSMEVLAPGGRRRWLVKALAMPASALAHLPKALTNAQLPRLNDRLKAAAMLFRLRIWRSANALGLLSRERT